MKPVVVIDEKVIHRIILVTNVFDQSVDDASYTPRLLRYIKIAIKYPGRFDY